VSRARSFETPTRYQLGPVTIAKRGSSVPDESSVSGIGVFDDRPAQMAEQLAQEYANLVLPDVVMEEQIVKPQAMSAGAYGNSRNDGDFVSPSLPVTMNGSLLLRSPGPDHIGNQQQAQFVGKDDVGTQPCSVFFIRRHSSCFQRSISSSFRSNARRSGFWGVHPKLCIKRSIWSG
jgi:hypothetical protein